MTILNLNGVMVDGIVADDDPFALFFTGCDGLAADIAKVADDLTLRINSYGGSVDGGTLLSVALSNWCASSGRALTGEIGAICASSAANLVARLPKNAKILVHPESMIMYHSCAGMVCGSPEALRDGANHMEKVNEVVIASLAKRTTLPEDTIRAWFREGREGWLNGLDAVACGLADDFAQGDFSPAPAVPEQGAEEGRWTYAAIAAIATKNKEIVAMAEEKEKTEEVEVEKTVETVPTQPEQTTEEPKPEEVEKTEIEKEIEALKAEIEDLKNQLAQAKAECGEQKELNAKLTAGMNAKPQTKSEHKTFAQLVREIPQNLPAREYADRFSALKTEHKAEYDAFMADHARR